MSAPGVEITQPHARGMAWVKARADAAVDAVQAHQHQLFLPGLDEFMAATSDEIIQRYALDWLKEKLEYTGRMRDFLDAIARAMRELERLEIIAGGRIESSTKGRTQAVWTRL